MTVTTIPRRLRLARQGLAGVLLAAAFAATAAAAQAPIALDAGKVSGTDLPSGVHAFFGIPYAAPPTGDNRWRAPQPPAPWRGVYAADHKQSECIQVPRAPTANHYFGPETPSEDCLYLNVWTPAAAHKGAGLPVVLWLHGGGAVGSAASPIYDGEALAKKGVIYVSANFRLGLFGLLAHLELSGESGHHASGNWGLLDQQAALQWVKRNIAAFGGDPANVTLMGQSSGAMAINDLQASPLGKALFARIIALSGSSFTGGGGIVANLGDAEAQGLKLQAALNADGIDAMRKLPPDKILAAARTANLQILPDIDGYFLTDTVDHVFAAGKQVDVPLLAGSTAKDAGTDVPLRKAANLSDYQSLARQTYGDRAGQFLALFPATDDVQARAQAEQLGRNSGYAVGVRNWVAAQTKTGKAPAFLFIVSHVQPFAPGISFSDFKPESAGAYHMSDVPYWLGTYDAFNLFRVTRNWTPYDRQLSDTMQNVVVSFARTGNPSTPQVRFAPYSRANETRVDFGDAITTETLDTKALDFIADMATAKTQLSALPRTRPPN
jgi:para-nitrobenzyl esterase